MGCKALYQAMYYHPQKTVKWLPQGIDFWEAILDIGQSSLLSVMMKTSQEIITQFVDVLDYINFNYYLLIKSLKYN